MECSYPSWGKNEFLPSYRGDWLSKDRCDLPKDSRPWGFMPCSVPLVFLATGMACYKVSVVVHLLSRVWLSATLWTAVYQASLPSTISWSLLKFVSNESVMLPNHLILCHPLFCLQFFPASGSFPMSQLFPSGGQCIEASASATVLPMRIQGWFSLGLTDLIFLLSKGLSRVFSSITIWKHQFFGTQMILIDL